MNREANIATQLRMIEAVNTGNLSSLKDIFTEDVVDHDAAPEQMPGPNGYIKFFHQFREAFPDLHVAVEHLTADADCIAIAVRVTGTHGGTHMGFAPTNRRIDVRGLQIARFNQGAKIIERWGSSDEMGMLRQIGAIK